LIEDKANEFSREYFCGINDYNKIKNNINNPFIVQRFAKEQTGNPDLSEQDKKRLEILQKAHEKKGKQLRFDADRGDLTEVDELRQLLIRKAENPDEKYDACYKGIKSLLMIYLPKGKSFKEGRQLIYDEKNVSLKYGKKKSDNNGIRKSEWKNDISF
jgi:hypothetical protein